MPQFFVIYLNDQSGKYEAVNGPNANKTFTASDGTDANGLACPQYDRNGKYVAFNVSGPNAAVYETFFDVPNSNLLFTAKAAGTAGNNIRIRYTVVGNNASLTVSVSTNDITVQLATNSSGLPTSTAAQIKTAIEAAGAANALIAVAHSAGSDGTGVPNASFTFRNLEYGSSGAAIASIVTQVESTTNTPTAF